LSYSSLSWQYVLGCGKTSKKKLHFENTYAIQNVLTGKALRPFGAHIENDVEIISYPLKNWECITWECIVIVDNTYLLKDLFNFFTLADSNY
jgi:hypothetical protein